MSNNIKRNTRIMIVEDDKLLADLLMKRLRDSGALVNHLCSGDEVLPILENEIPDILILDILLPGEGGFSILEKIKSNEKFKNIPVLLLSNLQSEKDIERGNNLGASGFIIKSKSDLESIVKDIEKALN